MVTRSNEAVQALFRSITDDGTVWLFLARSRDGWAITCDGTPVARGTSDHASVSSGVQKYLSLIAAREPLLQAQCA